MHLSPDEPGTAALFFKFLAGPARDAGSLTILGDLFDYWAGDDDLDDHFNARIIAALHELADHGIAVSFMAGNRDFLIGERFAIAAGIRLLPDPCLVDIHGTPTLLMHGDQSCTDDADYQRFRTTVRSPQWRDEFLARPLAERKREIEALRARSEHEKRIKPMAIMDVNTAAIEAEMRKHGARALIHGHTHRQGQHSHPGGTRWVLGDWHPNRGNALACDAAGWRWLEIS